LAGVANESSRYRFPAEVGVLLCLRDISAVILRGVACVEVSGIVFSAGEEEVLCWSNISKSPRTTPSFCGVGPRAFFEGVNRLRIRDGDSYGSTSHGCKEAFIGVFKGVLWTCNCIRLESWLCGSSCFRFRGVWHNVGGSGDASKTFPERMSRVLLYSLYFAAVVPMY